MTPTETAAAADLGRPSARKAGRHPRWPYVPVIIVNNGVRDTDNQVMGRAFATRAEAVACAERVIAQRRAVLAEKLAMPNMRALRRQYGLDS